MDCRHPHVAEKNLIVKEYNFLDTRDNKSIFRGGSDVVRSYFADCWHPHVVPFLQSRHASFHPTPQLLAQKRGRPRCHGNSISTRGPRTLDPILARWGPRKGRKVTEARKGFRYQPVEFSARRWPRWERNFSRSSRTPSLHTLSHPSLRGPRFSLLSRRSPFFLLPLSFFLSTLFSHFRIRARRIVCTGAKLSVISDRMARLTPARFYAPSWITCARTSIVCMRAWRWKLEKKRNSAPKCCDASIMKHGKGESGDGSRRDAHGFVQRNS